jgi:hypothetical protein
VVLEFLVLLPLLGYLDLHHHLDLLEDLVPLENPEDRPLPDLLEDL